MTDTSRSTKRKPLPTLLTIEEVANSLGVGVRHIRRLVSERRIPYLKWGHLLRFDPEDIRRWLDDAHVEDRPHHEHHDARHPPTRTV